jgi:hypothetical protein
MDRLLLALVVVVGVPAATVLYVAAVEWVLAQGKIIQSECASAPGYGYCLRSCSY